MEMNDGEDWKPINSLNVALKKHNSKITKTLDAIIASANEEDELISMQLQQMLGDSWIVGAKLAGAQGADCYTIYMENASIIRSLMRQMQTATYGLDGLGVLDDAKGVEENYISVLREEIDAFKSTFIKWVSYFEKDEFEDEWGLYR